MSFKKNYQKNKKFSEVYSNYYPLVFSAVYSRISNRTDAEDITQEIFITLYNKLDEVHSNRKWLFGALRFEVISYFKKKKDQEIDIDEVFQDVSLTFVNGFRDIRIILKEAVGKIDNFDDDLDRLIFDLIAVYRFSYKKSAKQLGLSVGKLRYRYFRVMDRILNHLQKQGINSLEDLL